MWSCRRATDGSFVVIDGYKRVRALRRLGRDTVAAGCWPGEEAEALIATRLMQTAEPETALEQSWLLAELHERFGLSLEELARRFSHSVSWVSRRLALVHELPDSIQERVRRGEMGAHGAAKYLVPLARANRQVCLELVEAIGATRLSSRDLGILYTAYQTGNWVTRQRLLEAPLVFLKSYKETQAPPAVEPGAFRQSADRPGNSQFHGTPGSPAAAPRRLAESSGKRPPRLGRLARPVPARDRTPGRTLPPGDGPCWTRAPERRF